MKLIRLVESTTYAKTKNPIAAPNGKLWLSPSNVWYCWASDRDEHESIKRTMEADGINTGGFIRVVIDVGCGSRTIYFSGTPSQRQSKELKDLAAMHHALLTTDSGRDVADYRR